MTTPEDDMVDVTIGTDNSGQPHVLKMPRARAALFKAALQEAAPHDPLVRKRVDEPHFILLARDPLSDGLVALWAALRGRRIFAVKDIVANLIVTAGKLPYQPDKDPEHVISAQQVSNAMHLWRVENTPKAPSNARGVDLDSSTQEPPMTDEPAKPIDHTTPLIRYLKNLAETEHPEHGLGIPVLDVTWPHADDTHFKTASAIRQSMYIGKLAEKRDGRLYITDAGRAAIEGK